MAVYTQVSAEAIETLLDRYDVGALRSAKGIAEGVENSNFLVETDQSKFILTLYEKRVSERDLPFFLSLLDHLAAAGLPVPVATVDRDGHAIQSVEGRPACLTIFLPGVPLSTPTQAQAYAAAFAVGRMHRALRNFGPQRANDLGIDAWTPLLERCRPAIDSIDPSLYGDLSEAVPDVSKGWDRGGDCLVIHADLFPDNILMLGDRVTGLIDFYFACTDLRLYDLAVMHSAWSFDPAGWHFNRAVADALLAGYADSFGLSPADRAALPVLAQGSCIRFALTRAWDWLNTPSDALVIRRNPMPYARRLAFYREHGNALFA